MLESKLELAGNEIINNKNTTQFHLHLEALGDLLLNIPYFKKFVETYADAGPLIFYVILLLNPLLENIYFIFYNNIFNKVLLILLNKRIKIVLLIINQSQKISNFLVLMLKDLIIKMILKMEET